MAAAVTLFLLALAFTSLAAASDMRSRRIPNGLPVGLLVCTAALTAAGYHPLGWKQALYGLLAASLITFPLFARGWMAGGDVKLCIALGATLGLAPFLLFFVGTSVAGGVLALRAKRRGDSELAYAPAMLLGLLCLVPLQWLAP